MMDYLKENLTIGEFFVYRWQAGELGSFQGSLAETIKKADNDNRERLKKSFPEEVEALENYWHKTEWWPTLERKIAALK